jgi:peroxiredoxin
MKKSIIIKCLFLLALSLSVELLAAQFAKEMDLNKTDADDKLDLSGTIPGLFEGEKIYISQFNYPLDQNSWRVIDSVSVKESKFFFQYHLDNGPRLFNITFPRHHNKFLIVALGNEKVSISSKKSLDEIPSETIFEFVRIDGSDIANEFIYLNFGLFRPWFYTSGSIDEAIHKLNEQTYNNLDLQRILGLFQAQRLLNKQIGNILLYLGPKRKLTPAFFVDCPTQMKRESFWVPLYDKLDDDSKKSYNGRIMQDLLPLCNNQPAPNFTFVTNTQKTISLNEICKQNKLTILHFWSNSSRERKRIHQELTEVYKKYQDKGLEIINVSLDANPEKWKRAILEDKIQGYQTCDFKEEESPIAKLYKMEPKSAVNILIDQNGKLIAWDIDGAKLFGQLYEVFGE